MKITTLTLVSILAACSTLPPYGSPERMKHDTRKSLTRDCVRYPQQFGFAYTRAQNADLLTVAPQHSHNVYSYCRKVAWRLVK